MRMPELNPNGTNQRSYDCINILATCRFVQTHQQQTATITIVAEAR